MGQAKIKRKLEPNAFMMKDMITAIGAGDFETVTRLVNQGFDLHRDEKGAPSARALGAAIIRGSPNMLAHLLNLGGDPNSRVDVPNGFGLTPLLDIACGFLAAMQEVDTRIEHVYELLLAGAELKEDSIRFQALPAGARANIMGFRKSLIEGPEIERAVSGLAAGRRSGASGKRRL